VDVLRQPGIDHEHDRELPHLARGERLALEAEALQLLEVLPRRARAVARHRLAGDRPVEGIAHLVDDRRQRAGMDLDAALRRLERPGEAVGIRVELDRDPA
jgi:hypothetical protein